MNIWTTSHLGDIGRTFWRHLGHLGWLADW